VSLRAIRRIASVPEKFLDFTKSPIKRGAFASLGMTKLNLIRVSLDQGRQHGLGVRGECCSPSMLVRTTI